MTVTHPFHPLRGQQVEIIRVRRAADPDLIIRLADGRHIAIAASWTDYYGPDEPPTQRPAVHLLDGDGLRQAAQLVQRIQQAAATAACTARDSGYDAPCQQFSTQDVPGGV